MTGNIRELFWKGLAGPFPYGGNASYIGSGAWLTNHQTGNIDVGGRHGKWTYFVKVVAVPAGATLDNGVWYTPGGVEIGPQVWGGFAIAQQVLNDPAAGMRGAVYCSPAAAGRS